MLFCKQSISTTNRSICLLVWLICVTLSTAITSDQQQQQNQLSDISSYGERLAESSAYVFNSVANSATSSFGSSVGQKDSSDGNFYSPGVSALLNSDGFLNTMSKFSPGGAEGAKYTPSGPVEAAVHTKKTIEVIPVRFEEPKEGEPQVIEISPYEVPLSIVFKTQTNKINVNQEHRSETPEEVKETTSEEEPHRVVHNVYRPVIQEVTEVIQPIRKMLQRVEPVIEEMKTIISKAGPPEGGSSNQHSNGYSRPSSGFSGFSGNHQKATIEDNRFARYGGNDLGRGLSIVPLSYSSASEVIKKLSSPPSTTSMSNENEISRRFGITNRPTRLDDGNSYSQQQQPATNNEDAPDIKPDYNELIKEYITKFLHEPKVGTESGASKSSKHSMKINPQSIKVFNVPLKNMPSNTIDSIKPYIKGSDQNQQGEKPKFKIIKEFRVTLDDLKKLKLAPFVLQANAKTLANKGISSSSSSSTPKNAFHSRSSTLKDLTNFSIPFSASSFKPMTSGMAVQESKHEPMKIIANPHNGPIRRMGDAPMTRLNNNANNAFNRPQMHVQESGRGGSLQKRQSIRQPTSPSLKGISPPNIVFASASNPSQNSHDLDRAFRRSAEDQAFFESKRLRA